MTDLHLTPQEMINLNSFSNSFAVEHVYNKEGFTSIEQQIIGQYFTLKGRVLDLGCGTGRTTAPLKENGYDVIGIDLSATMIEFARSKYPGVDFRVMNACALEFEDESFDHVLFSFNGIDNIIPFAKRLACLGEINRVLKKGGCFIFSSHNALCIPRNRDMLENLIRNCLNLRVFTKYRLESFLKGKLIQYYGIPTLEKKILQQACFQTLQICSGRYTNPWEILWRELSPYYICRKI